MLLQMALFCSFLGLSMETLLIVPVGCYDVYSVEAKGAAKHPTVHRTAPSTAKNYPVPNVSSAEVEKS